MIEPKKRGRPLGSTKAASLSKTVVAKAPTVSTAVKRKPKPKPKRKAGKPAPQSTFTRAKANAIIAWISDGKNLTTYCRQPNVTSRRAIYDWIKNYPDFAAQMEVARKLGAAAIAEVIIDIVDDSRNDYMEQFDDEGSITGYKINGENIQRSKLRAEMRLKLLACWHPKEYGNKIELSGEVGMTPEKVTTELSTLLENIAEKNKNDHPKD